MRHWQVNMMKLLFAAVLLPFMAMADAQFEVKSVEAIQSNPAKGLVDITLTMQGSLNDSARAVCTFVATNSATKTAIQVEHISQNGDVTGEGTIWKRKFIWDAKADAGEVKIDDVALTAVVELPFGGVQLWEGGPYWAECNVGATKPEECGYYFWWGDTVGYKRNANDDGWISVKDASVFSFTDGSCLTYGKDNSQLQSEGFVDTTGNLATEHDAATAHLGAPWRLPTGAELSALIKNCTLTWKKYYGVYGRLVTGKGEYATKTIFLPAAGNCSGTILDYLGSDGDYWSSTPNPGDSYSAWGISFYSANYYGGYFHRQYGRSVRPVRGFSEASALVSAATTNLSIDCTQIARIELLGVMAQQQGKPNGLVDIVVTMSGASNDVADAVCSFFATNVATKAAIQVAHITQNGDATGEGTVWTRKFIWDAKADAGEVKIKYVALTVCVCQSDGVQLWENGPYWAECNVGATKPEEFGYYFWWGDTVGYRRNANNDGWVSVKGDVSFSFESENCPTYGKGNPELLSAGYIDSKGELLATHDAASAHLGMSWRMPTGNELKALINNCTTTWVTTNGVNGRLVKGKGVYASKSIFLPAAGYGSGSGICDFYGVNLSTDGYYWSSTPDSDDFTDARNLHFINNEIKRIDSCRYYGRSVRPVRDLTDAGAIVDAATVHLLIDCSRLARIELIGVTALQQGKPNDLVDIVVTMKGSSNDVAKAEFQFAATNGATKAAIPIAYITQNGDVEGEGTVWTRKFVWDAKADAGAVKIDDVVLTVDLKPLGGVQLWENGPYWAECNVGASQPEECGYYFWWGDTVGYKREGDSWNAVDGSKRGFSFERGNCPTYGKNNSELVSAGYIDSTGNLVTAHDAATSHLGAPWRMPTGAEFSALISNCDAIWTTRNGVYGRLVTGKGNYSSKNIFLPAVSSSGDMGLFDGEFGQCWSATPSSDISSDAKCLSFYSWSYYLYGENRSFGLSVRPVREFADMPEVSSAGVTTHITLDCREEGHIDSPIRFADCPYWGFRFEGQMKGVPYKQEDCELKRGRTVAVITKRGRLDSYQPTDGSFFAIPVTGVGAKTEIQPVFSWATANENMIADCQILTDEEFRQFVSGGVSESTGWEKDDDDPDEVWLLQDFATMTSHSREWPNGLWPNGVSDGNRYWIYVRVNNLGYLDSELWSGDYTFRVGLGGTSEWTEPLHITFDSATDVSPSDMWRNVVFSGIKGWSLKDHHQGRFGGLSFYGLGLFSGSFPFAAEISVPSAGILYLSSGEGDDISEDALSVTSSTQILSDYTVWYHEPESWDPFENFCAYVGSGSLRALEVGSATTLSVRNTDTYRPELKLMRVQFYPAGRKSAAVEASYGSAIPSPYNAWDSETYLQGKVTGTDVYSSGETVRLVATPGPGEAFDHWEVLLGNVPTGINLLSPTLEFVMTDDVAGTPEERKQIIVRAVWREKCAVTALPVEAGTAVIDGCGLYFDGEAVEFKVKPAEGYEFVKWLDGSTENPRAVSAVSGGGERIYYAVVEKSDDGPDPDGGPYEGVVDGDTWLYSFRLSHVSEEFGAVCSLQNGEVEVGPGGRETGNWAVSPAPTGAVAVPQEVDGYSVVALGCSAFEDSGLTSISLPNMIRYLGGWCLSGCKKLESVSLPDSVVLVGDKAFDGCSKLKSVQLSRNLEYISWHAFDGCASLTSICLPGSVKAIGEDAFVDCDALTSVIFEGAPPVGVLSASIKQDAEIRYNMLYEEEWLPVIASAGWSNAKGYLPSQYVAVLNETNFCTSLVEAFQGLTSEENTIRLLDNTSSGWVKIEEGSCVALDLNGFTLTADCEGDKSLFELDGEMSVEDSRGGGCIVGAAYSNTSGGAFSINGVLTLNGGTISNFYAKVGGCAYVWQGGKLVIEDGVEILKCSSSEGGGGLYVRGELDFNGGLVSDCSSAKEGGGIKVEKTGVLNMAGGLVTGCTGVGAGGVFNRGVFLMTGGELSGNTATRSDYPDAVIVGDDLFMEYGDVSVTINDGSVKSSIGYHSSYLDGYKAKTFLQGGLYGDRPLDDFVTSGYAVKAVVDPDLLDAGWGYSVAVDEKTLSDLLVGCRDVASSGAAEWFTKQMEGVWVLQSGAIADRQASTLSCKVDGAGVLTFKWKVSSDCFEDYQDDYLNVEVDGQEVAWIAGEKGWLEQRIELAASDKPHEVKWKYSKDKSDAAGCDCGWLKDVVWTPEAVCHVTVSSLYGEPTGGGEYACGTTVVLDAPLLPMPSQAGEGWFICRGSSGSPVLTNHIEFVATCDTNIVWDVWQTNWFVWCDAAFSASEYADVAVKITPPTESLEAALGIEPVNGGSAPFGSIVEINVALKPGYIVSSWQGAPEARPNDTNVTLVVTGDRTFTPIFSEGAYLPSGRTGGKVIAIDEWVAMDEMSFLYGDMFWWRFTQNYGNDFTSAILSPNGKKRADGTPMEVWEDFVAGTDPTDLGSKFTSKIEIVNGKPVISWDPELTPEQAARRVYTTYGCSELGGEWYNADEAPAEVKSQLRFFKVGVEMR